MLGSAQAIIDEINNEKLLAEWKRTSSTTTIAPPPVVFEVLTEPNVAWLQWSYENWYFHIDKALRHLQFTLDPFSYH